MSRDVKLFLDSNVILSGLISSQGAPRILLDLLCLEVPHLKGMTGRYNLDEIERNLAHRFRDLLPVYQLYLPFLKLEVVSLPSYQEIEPFLGKMSAKDVPVLVAAQRGNADFLVTGDKKGFPKKLAVPLQVISPAGFLNGILPRLVSEWAGV